MNVLYSLFTHHRLVHSFTCAGVLQSQYVKLSLFAELGSVKNAYIRQGIMIYLFGVGVIAYRLIYVVYNKWGYVDLVSLATEHSMCAAIEEVRSLPHYESNGEVRTYNRVPTAKYTKHCVFFADP